MADSNIDRLRQVLDELFMFDRADLDFGLYRIMNVRRDEIRTFLHDHLEAKAREALGQAQAGEREAVEGEMRALEKSLRDAGVEPSSSPKFRELEAEYDGVEDTTATEAEVYGHLVSFFRRYYKEGDFISLRRYKEGVYAIPYEGEEVKLHWANADQYYIKSTEQFRDYTFLVSHPDEEPRRVHFRLVDADTERNNNRAQAGQDRRFILAPHTEDQPAVAEVDGELMVHFEYRRPDADEERDQKKLNAAAEEAVLGQDAVASWRAALIRNVAGAGAPELSLLRKHLNTYSDKNTFDYFIHKDLGGFLRRELDFYIKNEVVRLDDIAGEDGSTANLASVLRKVKAIRAVASPVIDFLASLEEFQKRLWLKKKFVVETHWCVTLDRVPPELYPEVAANDRQREEWVRLFAIDAIEGDMVSPAYSNPLTEAFLEANQHLVLDTSLFDREFTERLLASIEDLDKATDGLLVHSDNFQALNLLQSRFHEQVQCVYIDPPYNLGDDGFIYKDNYRHSSWLSMIGERLAAGRNLQPPTGTIAVSIDDVELEPLGVLLDENYSSPELATLVWDRNRKNDARYFSVGHEYMLVYARDRSALREAKTIFREPKDGLVEARELFADLRDEHGDDWAAIRRGWLDWFDSIPVSDPRRRLVRYSKVGPRGPYRDDGNISWPGGGGPRYEVLHPTTGRPCRVPSRGWVYPTPERFWEEYEAGRIIFGPDESTSPGIAMYAFDGDGQVMPSVIYSYAQTAAQEFNSMWPQKVFDNPKNWKDIARIIRYLAANDSILLDYFAGSGTTGHAVINLNREDGGQRKYLLVEMGEYFDPVLKPRVLKAAYSKEWKDGKPVGREGVSQLIKVIRLESYEDTLNNLRVERTQQQARLLEGPDGNRFREEHALRYWISEDTRDSASLLDLERFEDPWSYTLEVGQGSAAETKPVTIDLVETFNYLLGLRVSNVDHIRGVTLVQGTLPPAPGREVGEKALVIWRNTRETDAEALDKFLWGQRINPRDLEFDVIYVNGDNHLENSRRDEETWKVRLIEEEFHRLMFETADQERKQ